MPEGQSFKTKIFERPMHQLVAPAAVRGFDERFRCPQLFSSHLLQGEVDGFGLPQVRVQNGQRTEGFEHRLRIFWSEPTQDGSPDFRPGAPLIFPLEIVPFLVAFPVGISQAGGFEGLGMLGQLVIDFAAANVSNPQTLKFQEEFFIEKAAVQQQDDGDFRTIPLSNRSHYPAYHLNHGLAVIAVLFPAAKKGIHNESPPGHLQGLKAVLPLVCGLDAVPVFGFIVVHDHRIQTQQNHCRRFEIQSPQKQAKQHASENPHPGHGKRFEKALDAVGGQHFVGSQFQTGRIAFVLLETVEMRQKAAAAVHEKAQDLGKNLGEGLSLAVLALRSKFLLEPFQDACIFQILSKKGDTPAGGESVICDTDLLYLCGRL
jgi:hypothetical protein